MALPTSGPRRVVPLATSVADVDRRRVETGVTDVPRNAGTRRTLSKRTLLESIRQMGGEW